MLFRSLAPPPPKMTNLCVGREDRRLLLVVCALLLRNELRTLRAPFQREAPKWMVHARIARETRMLLPPRQGIRRSDSLRWESHCGWSRPCQARRSKHWGGHSIQQNWRWIARETCTHLPKRQKMPREGADIVPRCFSTQGEGGLNVKYQISKT